MNGGGGGVAVGAKQTESELRFILEVLNEELKVEFFICPPIPKQRVDYVQNRHLKLLAMFHNQYFVYLTQWLYGG